MMEMQWGYVQGLVEHSLNSNSDTTEFTMISYDTRNYMSVPRYSRALIWLLRVVVLE
jgi:hypothetical protein